MASFYTTSRSGSAQFSSSPPSIGPLQGYYRSIPSSRGPQTTHLGGQVRGYEGTPQCGEAYSSSAASPYLHAAPIVPPFGAAQPVSPDHIRRSVSRDNVGGLAPPAYVSPFSPHAPGPMDMHSQRRIQRSATSDVTPPGPSSPTSDRFWAPRSQQYPDGYASQTGPRRGSLPIITTPSAHTASVLELRRASASSQASHSSSDSSTTGAPRLSIPQPTMGALARRREAAIASGEERQKVQWARRVMRYVEREHGTAAKVVDPTLSGWIDDAMATINRRANASPPDVEALYLRGDLKASGNFAAYHVKDPRDAFTDFEKSGRCGFPASWYRIGRDYELHRSYALSKDAYERGCQLKDTNSTFRMGRAYLFGQLNLKQDFEKALPLLKLAADMANEDLPEPGFFYGQLYAGEYAHLNIPEALLRPVYATATAYNQLSAEQLALRYIERAAYLNHASAQLKLGWAHEYAKIGCSFDALLSVQYYSLASKGGKAEADVALSRWFLCGAEGCFEKNEALAFTFAEKATRRSLPAAEFALAYYYEVGVGCEKNLPLAMKWYQRSAAQGNADAQDRLTALIASKDAAVSRSQYEAELNTQMTRGHTAARNLSIREGRGRRGSGRRPLDATAANISIEGGLQSVSLGEDRPPAAYPVGAASQDLSRKRTLRMVNELATTQQVHHGSPASGRSTPMSNQPRSRVGSSSDHPVLASPGQAHQQRSGINRTPSPSGRRANGASGAFVTPPPPPQQRMQSNPGSLLSPATPEQRDSGKGQGRRGSAGGAAASGRRVSESPGMETTPGGGRKYSTFAEMGLQSSAMDKDKDCIVM